MIENDKTAQHSVHPTGGSLRVFRQFAWLEVDSVKMALSHPTHQRVTQAVRWLNMYNNYGTRRKIGATIMDNKRKTDWAKIRREWGAMLTLLLTAASLGLDVLSIFPQFRWSIVALISFVTFCYLVW